MAANFGRFIDRSPLICAAGKCSGELDRDVDDEDHNKRHYYPEDYSDAPLKETSSDDAKQEQEHDAQNEKVQAENDFMPELLQNVSIQEEPIQIQLLESPTFKEEIDGLMDEPKLTSSKNIQNSQEDDSVTGLMHPQRTPYQVMWDSQVGHERYRTTHDDYNAPKEIKNREPLPAGPEKCLNAAGKYNRRGIWVRCACDWHAKEITDRSLEIEADYVDRHNPQIGKSLSPNHNIDSVPKGFAFGTQPHHESYGMEELLKDSDCPPCIFKREFYTWMGALNKCRDNLKERNFNFREFFARSSGHDKEQTGFLPVDEFYDICVQEQITFHKEEIESLLKVLKIIVDDKINYGRFIEIIDVNKPTIDIVPFHDIPKEFQHYETTNKPVRDYLITDEADLPPAGEISEQGWANPNLGRAHLRSAGEESERSPLNFQNN